jgi:nickel superoxide dismutase
VHRTEYAPKETLMSRFASRIATVLRPPTVAYAHCDIPCGIYDPHAAELAAQTVAKMVELLGGLDGTSAADRNKFTRCVTVKEQHAEIVKHEVQVIWSDYFKPEHLAANPDLHTKVWNLLKLAGKNKQNIDAEAAAQLQASVKEFAEIFWSTKK